MLGLQRKEITANHPRKLVADDFKTWLIKSAIVSK